jgi:FkbM family methyltransferase
MKNSIKKNLLKFGLGSIIRHYHTNKIRKNSSKLISKIEKYVLENGGKFKNSKTFSDIELFEIKIQLRNYSSDLMVFEQIFIQEEYKKLIEIIKNTKIDVKIIVDAGANIGLSALYINHQLNTHSPILYCIEADFENNKCIHHHISSNQLNNVHTINAGLWDKPGYLAVKNDFRDGAHWSLRVAAVNYETKLKAITMQELMTQYQLGSIDLLKIDIEGSEGVLLRNKLDLATYLPKVKIICLEVHEEVISNNEVIQILTDFGFTCQRYLDLTVGVRKDLH